MTVQFSVPLRNNRLDQIEVTTGTSAKLQLFTGTPPVNCAAADSGTMIAEILLPFDWMNSAANGQKTLSGTWNAAAVAAGVVGHFRLKTSDGTTCHMQGTAGMAAADMILDNSTVTIGQTVNVTTFNLTDGNA